MAPEAGHAGGRYRLRLRLSPGASTAPVRWKGIVVSPAARAVPARTPLPACSRGTCPELRGHWPPWALASETEPRQVSAVDGVSDPVTEQPLPAVVAPQRSGVALGSGTRPRRSCRLSFRLPFRLLLPVGFPSSPQAWPPGPRRAHTPRPAYTLTAGGGTRGPFPGNSLSEKGGSHFLGSQEPSSPCPGSVGLGSPFLGEGLPGGGWRNDC